MWCIQEDNHKYLLKKYRKTVYSYRVFHGNRKIIICHRLLVVCAPRCWVLTLWVVFSGYYIYMYIYNTQTSIGERYAYKLNILEPTIFSTTFRICMLCNGFSCNILRNILTIFTSRFIFFKFYIAHSNIFWEMNVRKLLKTVGMP